MGGGGEETTLVGFSEITKNFAWWLSEILSRPPSTPLLTEFIQPGTEAMITVTCSFTDGLGKKVMFQKRIIIKKTTTTKTPEVWWKCHDWCAVLTCVWAWRWVWWRGWWNRGCGTERAVLHHGRGWVRQGVRCMWLCAGPSAGRRGRCCGSPCLVGNAGGLVVWRYWCYEWRPQGFAVTRPWLCWGAETWGEGHF